MKTEPGACVSPPIRLAYLLSQYPAVNHVFMLREIRFLREQGFEIHAASVSGPDRPLRAMTAVEQEETRSTYYVKEAGFQRVLRAHLRTALERPAGYFRGLFYGLSAGAISHRGLLFGFLYFAEAVVIGDWMKDNRLTHLHTHFASTVAMIVARIFPVTMSATFHGPAEFQDPVAFQLAAKIQLSLFSCAISQFSQSQLMYASDYSEWHKLEITPLGVDITSFSPERPRKEDSVFQIICVGRLAPVKAQHVLIAAAERLVKQGHEFILRFVGDGPDRSALQRDAASRGLSGRIFFEGNVNQDRLRELYDESDVFVLPSFGEGLPVVLMEAMAMEIPCISTWIAGVPELIEDGIDGLLVPPGDEEALACAIIRLKDDPALRKTLGEQGRERVLERFDINKNGRHLAEVFVRRLRSGLNRKC